MKSYFLGVDVGGSKTHALITDENGNVCGFGKGGPGNHESVGYQGLRQVLSTAVGDAASQAGITLAQITGAGFGVAGYDWPSERSDTLAAISVLGLTCPLAVYNDAVLGLAAGSPAGWGVNLIAGTSNNCYGRNPSGKEGRVTGAGMMFGEYGGALEIAVRAMQAVNYAWIKRGPQTALTERLLTRTGCESPAVLMEMLATEKLEVDPIWALDVFSTAAAGDVIAAEIVAWAGKELGELACAVIRQLDLAGTAFDLVLSGSLYQAGEPLFKPLRETVLQLAPQARLINLNVPPVVGAVLLGMEAAGLPREQVYSKLLENGNFLKDR